MRIIFWGQHSHHNIRVIVVVPLCLFVLSPVVIEKRTVPVARPLQNNLLHLDSAVYEYSVLVSFNIKVEQGDEALGGLVEIHTTLGTVNGDIRGSTSPGSETEARQASQVFPGLAGYKDVLQLAQSSAQT